MQPNASTRLVRSGSPAACVFAGTMAIATLLAAHSARAASYSWTPTAAGAAYEWNTTTQDNWGTGVAGSFPNAVDDTANLNINLAGAQTVSLNQAVTLGALNLGDATTSFFATTLQNGTGGSLTFDVSSGNAAINKVTAANTAADIISATITLNDNLVVNNAATASTGSLTISGNIGDGSSGKTLTKIGVGTLILSGTNAYTGGTSINNGSLQFNSSGAIADSGRNVTVASGAVAAAGYAMDNAFLNRLSENSNAAVIALGAASSNNLDLSSATGANLPNAFLGATGAFAYSGSLTPGSNGFRLGGGGGTLAASSVLGGTTNGLTVGGNVTLQSSTVNTFTGGVNLTNGGMIGGVSATLGNPNTLTLNFANLTAAPNNNLIDATNVLTLGGGRLHLTGKNSAASSQTFASTTLNANTTSIVSMTVGTGTASVGITLGTITRSPGSTLYYAQQGGTLPNGTTLLAPTTTANEASGILAPWSFASASAYAANNGSGQIVAYTVPGGNSFTTAAGLSGMNDANANFQMTGTNGSTYTIT
ncbi:MAG: autotransporter-associated beta strand repeat-containing protein, partial [Verrucomicrobia bacterium]|nr:autotransporter-associated beta strand repeat-containing protein [Verrucomicrobiota bacterium]